jgi:hypothetical protein
MDLSLTLLRVIEVPEKLVFLKIYLFLISFSKSGGSSDFPNLRPSLGRPIALWKNSRWRGHLPGYRPGVTCWLFIHSETINAFIYPF